MNRFHHYLQKNHGTHSPTNILFVDTEAKITPDGKNQIQEFRLGYCILSIRKEYDEWQSWGYELKTVDDFWKILDRYIGQEKLLYVIAHNMAYDYTILKLDTYISSRKLEITQLVIDSVYIVKAENFMFISSTNFYRQSLEKLGKIFGISKMEKPDFQNVSDEELMPYCKRDTEVLATLIHRHIDFIKSNDLGCFKPTIASQAFTAYRHRFMNHKLLVHCYPEIIDMEKESYRGGRCEAFKLGKYENIYKVDINSMYPFVMKNNQYPLKPLSDKPVRKVTMSMLDEAISKHFVIAECDIELKEPLIACRRDKLIFPIGKIHQTVVSPEIKYLLNHPECGTISKIRKMVCYEQGFIFSDYVDFFYNVRMSAKDEAIENMSKLFLNSLYGKFGQRSHQDVKKLMDEIQQSIYKDIMREEGTFEVFDGANSKYVLHGSDIYYFSGEREGYSTESIPIISSAVTGYSRVFLFELMKIAGEILYCDTDSLFVFENGYENLRKAGMIDQKELGKMKLEETGSVEIFGAKDYHFNSTIKLKGIKHDAEKIDENTYRQFQFQTKNSRYRNGTPDGLVILKSVEKKIKRNYDKGVACGNEIMPYYFNEF